MKLNVPNQLTLLRMILIPVFLVFLVIPPLYSALGDTVTRIVSAVLFALISLTDMLDGKIARKYNLITDFGKFMDPLADKMLVFSACLGILVYCGEIRAVFVWVSAIVMFRELAVTGIRLLVAGEKIVVAASWLGKVKTVTQILAIIVILLEPVLFGGIEFFAVYRPLSYLTMLLMAVMTLWSGINYMKTYWKYLDPAK